VSNSLDNIPQARSWRDIPQQLKPRAMSHEGRWRLALAALRVTGVAAVVAGLAWGAWIVTDVLQESPKKLPAIATATPVKNFELLTDGGLDETWLRQTLALPKGASLMELDLEQLRARLLVHGQVATARIARKFPDTLVANLTERSPVVRLQMQFANGDVRTLLVARDGVFFDGVGFNVARLATLPWLDGVKPVRQGDGFRPIEGMAVAAELLAKAQFEATHLYANWHSVSLARLASDREIEVRTKEGTLVVFGADGDFRLQLARLNYQVEQFAARALTAAKVDLSFGREVVVALAPAPVAPTGGAVVRPKSAPALSFFPN
jgi:hypothetical protein